MMSSASLVNPWAALCRIKLHEHALRRLGRTSPTAFRQHVRLSCAGRSRRFGDLIQPWQAADFAALDAAWQRLAGRGRGRSESESESERGRGRGSESGDSLSLSTFPFTQRAWIERPRGHSKTSDMAVQIAWILLFARRTVRGLAAAADRDQATLIWNAVFELARVNPLLCRELDFRRHLVVNRRTESELSIISSDVNSSWGALPDFIICDELCHWERPDLWYSLFSSAAKRPDCVLTVLTNAGIGRGWHWDVREAARTSPAWHFSSLDGPQAPWIDAGMLAEQQRLLPPAVYARLWENRWQHSDGEFVTLAEAEACRDLELRYQTHGHPGRTYIAAIDYAEKHDLTVGVVLHVECDRGSRMEDRGSRGFGAEDGGWKMEDGDSGPPRTRIVVDRMDVIAPSADRPTPVAWVEAWMHEIARNFHHVAFVVDEYQLLGTIQRLETMYDVRRFEFRAGRGNHALALNLRKLIVNREIAWYAGCGQHGDRRPACAPEGDDLEMELASLLFHQTPSGLCRIDHRRDDRHHDDRSFALGAACLHVAQQPPPDDWLAVTPPEEEGGLRL